MINASLSPRMLSVVSAVLLVVGGGEAFYSHKLSVEQRNLEAVINSHGDMLRKLSQEVDQAKDGYGELAGDLAFTKDRLGATQVELRKTQQSSARVVRQQTEAAKRWNTEQTSLQQAQAAAQGTIGNLSSDVAGVKDGLNSTKEELASTRTDLQRVVGDLGVQSGLIATNHNELEELKMLGERDYAEFDLPKTKQPQRVGTVSLAVKKTDTKRQRYTINLIADDRTIEKKDKTVNEPVQFYQSGNRQPTEIVVNQIYKDRIVGYVAFPKKRDVRSAISEITPGQKASGSGGETNSLSQRNDVVRR